MAGLNYGDLFDGWEIGLTKNIIDIYRRQWACLAREDFDDLMQECLTHWHISKSKFNAQKGSVKTFMGAVLKHKLMHIIEKLTTDKRKALQESVELGESILDKPQETDSKIDVDCAVNKLNPRQRKLCRLLGEDGLTVSETAKALKISRFTIYEDIRRIKTLFQKEALNEYLD